MQSSIRDRLKHMISTYGTTQAFIGKEVGVSKNFINMFLKGERNLSEQLENKLIKFLEERNL